MLVVRCWMLVVGCSPPSGNPGGHQRDGADDGEILPVVRHQGIAHEVDVHKPQDGEEQQHEIAQAEQQRLSPLPPIPPAQQECRRQQQVRHVSRHMARVNSPPGIDETQVQRQHRLIQIEPDRPARSRQARPESVVPHVNHAGANRLVGLKPQRYEAHRCRQSKEGSAPPHIPQLQSSAPPPSQAQQHERQRRHRRLAQKCQREGEEREGVEKRGWRMADGGWRRAWHGLRVAG